MEEPFSTQAVDPALLQRWRSPLYAKEMEANPNTPKNRAAAAIGQRNLNSVFAEPHSSILLYLADPVSSGLSQLMNVRTTRYGHLSEELH
jgi:hypothetical protein